MEALIAEGCLLDCIDKDKMRFRISYKATASAETTMLVTKPIEYYVGHPSYYIVMCF